MAKTIREMFPREQTLYTSTSVDKLIADYTEAGGQVLQMREGTLGYCIRLSFGRFTSTSGAAAIPCGSIGKSPQSTRRWWMSHNRTQRPGHVERPGSCAFICFSVQ